MCQILRTPEVCLSVSELQGPCTDEEVVSRETERLVTDQIGSTWEDQTLSQVFMNPQTSFSTIRNWNPRPNLNLGFTTLVDY